MNRIEDLLKEFPDLAAAREKLAAWQDKHNKLAQENEALKKDNEKLKAQIAELEKRQGAQTAAGSFIEAHGVLWQKGADGSIEKFAYCPKCRLVMTPFPPGNPNAIVCTQCKFRAPFAPRDVNAIAQDIGT